MDFLFHSEPDGFSEMVQVAMNTVFNPVKAINQAISSDPLHIGSFDKTTTSFNINSSTAQVESQRFSLEKNKQLNPVSISSGNTENGGESNMADGSPRTDISTDADIDDKIRGLIEVNQLLLLLQITVTDQKIKLIRRLFSDLPKIEKLQEKAA